MSGSTRLVTAMAVTVCVTGLTGWVLPVPAHADSVRDSEWAASFLHLSRVHKSDRGKGVVVGVIDTGVDASHPDLQGNVREGTNVWDGWKGDGHQDENGHGTHTSSIIPGHGHGTTAGVMGVAPQAQILPVSVKRSNGRWSDPTAVGYGIKWAVDRGATVIDIGANCGDGDILREEVGYALKHDVVVVAPIGDTAHGAVTAQYPAVHEGVVAVSSIGRDGKFSHTSVANYRADIAASGVDIVGASPDGGYSNTTETSDAAAFVAGAAALVRSRFPNLSAQKVRQRLLQTADDHGKKGHDLRYGDGVLNIVRALDPEFKVTTSPAATLSVLTRKTHRPVPDAGTPVLNWVIAGAIATMLLCIVLLIMWLVGRHPPPSPPGF